MSAITNLTIDQGSDFIYFVHVVNSSGNTINLSSYTANSQIRPSYSSNVFYSAVLDMTSSANGQIVMIVNSHTSSLLTNPRYVYDLELTSNTGIVSKLLSGFVTVNPSVTR